MHVDVFTPDDHVGDVIGDLNRRRGMIKDQMADTGVRVKVWMCHYQKCLAISAARTNDIRRGQFSMEFSHYNPCPANVSEDVIAAEKERQAAK